MKNPKLIAEDVLREITHLLESFPQLADDEDLMRDTLEGSTDFNEVMDRLLGQMRENETLAEAVSARVGKLRERQTRLTHRAQFYRGLMHRLLERANIKSVTLPEAKISVVKSADKVIIVDESAIVDEYMVIKKEPNKTAIKKALKEGKNVPGAVLSNGGETIMVRT